MGNEIIFSVSCICSIWNSVLSACTTYMYRNEIRVKCNVYSRNRQLELRVKCNKAIYTCTITNRRYKFRVIELINESTSVLHFKNNICSKSQLIIRALCTACIIKIDNGNHIHEYYNKYYIIRTQCFCSERKSDCVYAQAVRFYVVSV